VDLDLEQAFQVQLPAEDLKTRGRRRRAGTVLRTELETALANYRGRAAIGLRRGGRWAE
jgi:hypothetical protein